MSSSTALAGWEGYFKVGGFKVARCSKWSVSAKALTSEWGDSDGEGFTNRLMGRWDCLFKSEGKFDTVSEFYNYFDAGDIVAADLYITDDYRWHFPRALNLQYDLVCDVDRGEVVGWTSDWGSDGQFYNPGESGY